MRNISEFMFRLGIFVLAATVAIVAMGSLQCSPSPVVIPNNANALETIIEQVIVTATPDANAAARLQARITEDGGNAVVIEESEPVIIDVIHTVVPRVTSVPTVEPVTPTVTPTAFATLTPFPTNTATSTGLSAGVSTQENVVEKVIGIGSAIVQTRRAIVQVVPTVEPTPHLLPTPKPARPEDKDPNVSYVPPALKLPRCL